MRFVLQRMVMMRSCLIRLLALSLICGLSLSCSYAPPAIDGAMLLQAPDSKEKGFWVSNHGVRVTSPTQPLNDIESSVVDTSYVGTRITPYSAIAYFWKYAGGGLNMSNTNTMVFASFYIPQTFSITSYAAYGMGTVEAGSRSRIHLGNVMGGVSLAYVPVEEMTLKSSFYKQNEYTDWKGGYGKNALNIGSGGEYLGSFWSIEAAISYNSISYGSEKRYSTVPQRVLLYTLGYNHILGAPLGRVFAEITMTLRLGLDSSGEHHEIKAWKGDSTNVLYKVP
ncbi:MAG: hypothetical protein OCD76_08910 [Reichenbachiella sp.]